jgi:hypothetical protein
MTINYNQNIDYGYEVNYLIYNYMVYFQNTNKKTLVMFLQDNVTIFVIIINKMKELKGYYIFSTFSLHNWFYWVCYQTRLFWLNYERRLRLLVYTGSFAYNFSLYQVLLLIGLFGSI